jgi:hypothetical protein
MAVGGDELLTEQDVESALSKAYVQAIAGHAGYVCGTPPEPDRDSVDIQISAGGPMRPKLDVQLKSTMNLRGNAEAFSYALKLKNYEDLRIETQTPRILVILDLPDDRSVWLTTHVDQLVIRRCAYWLSLQGMPASSNTSSVTLNVPRSNVFDVASIVRLMEMSRTGRIQ